MKTGTYKITIDDNMVGKGTIKSDDGCANAFAIVNFDKPINKMDGETNPGKKLKVSCSFPINDSIVYNKSSKEILNHIYQIASESDIDVTDNPDILEVVKRMAEMIKGLTVDIVGPTFEHWNNPEKQKEHNRQWR